MLAETLSVGGILRPHLPAGASLEAADGDPSPSSGVPPLWKDRQAYGKVD